MLDLDKLEKIPEYSVMKSGKKTTYDTVLLVSQIGSAIGSTADPLEITKKMSEIMNLQLNTQEALAILRDIEEFSDKYVDSIKNLFGRSQSASTTTDSAQTNSKS